MMRVDSLNKYRKPQEAVFKHTGHFVPVESRKEMAQELKRTHFILGNDKDQQNKLKMDSQVATEIWNIDPNHQNQQKKIGAIIKASHVQLGESNNIFSQATTHQVDYNKKSVDQARVAEAKDAKSNLRKAHFNMGNFNNDAETFTTTNMERFKQNKLLPAPSTGGGNTGALGDSHASTAVDSRKSVSIVYGNQKPLYQSSTQESMVQHDMAQSLVNKHQSHQQGLELRKHNFQLGFQGQSLNKESQYANINNDFRSKSQGGPPQIMTEIKKNHFELGSKFQGNDYISSTKHAQAKLGQGGVSWKDSTDPEILQAAQNTRKDLRMSHFNLGNNPTIQESSSYQAYKGGKSGGAQQLGTTEEIDQIRGKMQKGNFRIGEDKNQNLPHETTYAYEISNQSKQKGANGAAADASIDDRKHLQGSINFGSHNQKFDTENKSKFLGAQNRYEGNVANKNRNQSFKLGDNQQSLATSVSKQEFGNKGNPMEIRGTLNEAQMNDLRGHHFTMGSHINDFNTSSGKNAQDTFNGGHNSTRGGVENKLLLQHSGQRVFTSNLPQGTGLKGDYKTTNQHFIKWIQPSPQQMNSGWLPKPLS